MIDPLSMIVGALLLIAGIVFGHITGRRKPVLPVAPTVPMCPCGHDIAIHDPTSSHCRGSIRREHYYKGGDRNGWEWTPCPCRRYLGPELLRDIWTGPGPALPPVND